MKKILSTFLIALSCATVHAESTKTIFNPFTGKPDYITSVNGQNFQSGSGVTVTCTNGVCTFTGGGGGASSLQVTSGGVQISSPTSSINFSSTNFILSNVGGSTATVSLMPVSLSTGVTGVLPTFMGGTGNTIAGSIANGTLYIGSGSPGFNTTVINSGSDCSGTSNALTWSSSMDSFGCNTITSGGGSGSGTNVPSPQYQLGQFSVSGSSNVITGSPDITAQAGVSVTIDTATVSSMTVTTSLISKGTTKIYTPLTFNTDQTGVVTSEMDFTQKSGLPQGLIRQYWYSNSGPNTFSTPLVLINGPQTDFTAFSQAYTDAYHGFSVVAGTNTPNIFAIDQGLGNHLFTVSTNAVSAFTYGVTAGSLTVNNVASGTQCLHADSSGHVTGTGSDCGSGGGGGSSSLQVTRSGVQVTSPTASQNFYGGDFILSAVGSTSTIALNPATTDYIQNTTTIQTATETITGPINTNSYYKINSNPVLWDGADTFGGSIIVGNSAMNMSTQFPSRSVCIGGNACSALTNAASNTVAIGVGAGNGLTSGSSNVCIGEASCNVATTSSQNACVGAAACEGLTTNAGGENAIVGYNAMPSATTAANNAGIGNNVFDKLTTASNDVAVGPTAAGDMTTGSMNVCVGGNTSANGQACTGVTVGSSNTMVGAGATGIVSDTNGGNAGNSFLGWNAGSGSSTNKINESICLGMNCVVTSSFTAVIGGVGTNDAVTVVMSTFSASSGTISGQFTANSGIFNTSLTVAGNNVCQSNGTNCPAGGGVTVYPATATASFPFGLSVSTIQVNGSNGNIQLTILGSTYSVTASSTIATNSVGHLAVWSSTNGTIIDNGPSLALVNSTIANTLTISTSATGVNLLAVSSIPATAPTDYLLNISSVSGTQVLGVQNGAGIIAAASIRFSSTSQYGVVGSTLADNALAGNVGEYISSAAASAVSFPGTGNFGDLVSMSLTPGDWDVTAVLGSQANSATVTTMSVGISSTTGNSTVGMVEGDSLVKALGPTAATDTFANVPNFRISLSTTKTYYLKFSGGFSIATPNAVGRLSARRIR